MHIGFDISQTGTGRAGCGFFAHALVQGLLEAAPETRFSLYPSFGDFYFDARMPVLNPYRGSRVAYGPRHLTRGTAERFWTRPGVDEALGFPDVIHANNYWCPVGLRKSRLVYTCYDLGFAVEPSWTTERNRVGCFEGVFRAACAADWIVAISRASRAHYLGVFPHFPEERIRVIHPFSRFAPGQASGRRPRRLERLEPGAFWLTVGTIEPRKNHATLAKAYARYLALGGRDMPLVIAGGEGWRMEGFPQRLRELGIEERVWRTGYVTDEELGWLYRNCFANLYPSLFEGFGLPVLEGMQFGAATLSSNAASLPEVAGDAAVLIDPLDTEAWAREMLRLCAEGAWRAELARRAPIQAARFSPEASVKALLALYEEAISLPPRAARAAA